MGPERLVRRDGGYALVADWWDVAELEALTAEALRRADAGDQAAARTAAEGALALVRDALLADEPDAEWAEEPRAAAAAVVAEARRVAAGAALATGQVGSAAALATEALRHDPYDEQAVRTLMSALAAAGRPASALAEYARFRELLGDELGVEPSAETRALHERLLREEPPAPAPVASSNTLVGRDEQLATLDAELAAGGARVVLLTGEPGAGKSALMDVWGTAAAARGVAVLRGRAEEGELALQPVLDALAANLADLPEDLRPDTDPGAGRVGPARSGRHRGRAQPARVRPARRRGACAQRARAGRPAARQRGRDRPGDLGLARPPPATSRAAAPRRRRAPRPRARRRSTRTWSSRCPR